MFGRRRDLTWMRSDSCPTFILPTRSTISPLCKGYYTLVARSFKNQTRVKKVQLISSTYTQIISGLPSKRRKTFVWAEHKYNSLRKYFAQISKNLTETF